MNNLLEKMAEANYNKDVGIDSPQTWEVLPEFVRADLLDNMKAALEVLKNPPAEFLEAMLSMNDQMEHLRASVGFEIGKSDMHAILQAAINQTLKESE